LGIERGGGRSPEERQAAAEARMRARRAREQGLPVEEEAPDRSAGGGWNRPNLGAMRRHYGGGDVYARRRLVAIGAAVVILLLLFLVLVGC
jgi:hypothetical protein